MPSDKDASAVSLLFGCLLHLRLTAYGAAGATGKVVARCTFLPLLRNLLAPVAEIAPADVNGETQYARGLHSTAAQLNHPGHGVIS